jgi:hypothetical protein
MVIFEIVGSRDRKLVHRQHRRALPPANGMADFAAISAKKLGPRARHAEAEGVSEQQTQREWRWVRDVG